MTLGHFPNPLAPFTEYTFGYASSPDGFVFLSGLVASWVYLPLRMRLGKKAMRRKIFRRAGTIYLTHLALVVAGILVASNLGTSIEKIARACRIFLAGALLTNQAGFDRILPMYVVFLACTPLVLKQLIAGRARLVGLVSASLWTAAQFGFGDWTTGGATGDHGNFNLFAWQAYFIAGQYLGWRGCAFVQEDSSGISGDSPALPEKSLLAFVACALIAALLMVDRHLGLIGKTPWLHFSGHPDHNPMRFLDAACLGYLVWRIPRSVDLHLMQVRFFRFLNLLGRHSLQVFAFSMLITRFEAHTIERFSWGAKLIFCVATIASLSLPALVHELWRTASKPALAPKFGAAPSGDLMTQEVARP